MNTAKDQWTRFIERLEEMEPLIFHNKDGSYQLPHTNFLGSISKYRRIFLDANPDRPPPAHEIHLHLAPDMLQCDPIPWNEL